MEAAHFYRFWVLVSLLVSIFIAAVALNRPKLRGARWFGWAAVAQAVWHAGHLLELISESFDSKLFWDNIQWIGTFGYPGLSLAFALGFTGGRLRTWFWAMLAVIPALTLVSAFLNTWLGWIHVRPRLENGVLTYEFGALTWIAAAWAFALMFGVLGVLASALRSSPRLLKIQTLILIAGFSLPTAGGIVTLLGLGPSADRDLTPFTFTAANLVVAWGLFRLKLFDVGPVARNTVFEKMADAVLVLDVEGRILDLNESAVTLLGRREDDLLGTTLADSVPFLKEAAGSPTASLEISEGDRRLDVKSAPLKDSGGGIMARLLIVRDETERIKAQDRVKQQAQELAVANRELDAFSYSVAHDLRSPLTSIAGWAELLLRDPAGGREGLEEILSSSRRMSGLIESLLALARSTRQPIRRSPVDLTAEARQILQGLEKGSPGRRVDWTVEENLATDAQPELARSVLQNLLQNAWKFTSKVGAARILVGSESGRTFVRDNGVGFDPTSASKLFESFQRLHPKAEYEGSGIGLATVKRIIDRHGGTIEAVGAPGQGATFYFTF